MITAFRGQSAVLGIVVLFGLVAVGSAALLVAGDVAITGVEHQTEKEVVEQSFVELSEELNTVSNSGDVSRAVTLALGDRSDGATTTDDGHVEIRVGNDTVADESLGTVEYTTGDGTVFAYQGGGVWRGTGSEARMVSSPEVGHDNGSLHLPVTTISGERTASAGALSVSNADSTVANSSFVTGQVEIRIESRFHAAWARYFEDVEGATLEADGSGDGEVVVTFGDEEEVEADDEEDFSLFSQAVATQGSLTLNSQGNAGNITGDLVATDEIDVTDSVHDGEQYENRSFERIPHDDSIDDLIDDADEWETLDGSTITDPGTYYVDDIDTNELTADVSEGDVTLVLNESADLAVDDVHVTDAGDTTALKIYTKGDVTFDKTEICVDECLDHNEDSGLEKANPVGFQLYVASTSDVTLDQGGNAVVEGFISAPADASVVFSGNPTFYGAIDTGSMDLKGGPSVLYDESFADDYEPPEVIEVPGREPPRYPIDLDDGIFLNVVVYEVGIDDR